MTNRFFPDALKDFASAIYRSAGMPDADARLVADTLVQADLWGHQSHGVLRLPWYLARLKAGVCATVASPEFVVDGGAVAVIDGKDAMGQVLTDYAMPGETGVWLLARVRQQSTRIPVVVITGYHDADVRHLRHASFARVLRKPVGANELCHELIAALEGSGTRP